MDEVTTFMVFVAAFYAADNHLTPAYDAVATYLGCSRAAARRRLEKLEAYKTFMAKTLKKSL